MGGRTDEEKNLLLLMRSEQEKDIRLGLHLATHSKVRLKDITELVALALLHKHQSVRELGLEALQYQAAAKEINFIRENWESTYMRGNPAFLYDAVGRVGELERVDRENLLRLAVRLTGIFPEERAHVHPAAFLEYCETLIHRDGRSTYLVLNGHNIPFLPAEIAQSAAFLKLSGLSLRNCGLRKLPPEITQIKGLESLDVSNNKLRSLPAFLAKLPRLNTLTWKDNPIAGFPEVLGRLPLLSRLHLVMRKDRDYAGISRCSALNSLDIELRPGALPFPEAMFELKNVEKLDLNAMECEGELPEKFSKWTSLRFLKLILPDEHPFPSFVCALPQLSDLTLTSVSEFPGDLQPITQPHLHSLYLGRCRWNTWPQAWSDFPSLRELTMSRGNLSEFPAGLKNMHSLENLKLSHLPIRKFPEFILKQKQLKLLSLSHLELDEIPEQIIELKHLEHLTINALPIRSLPENLKKMPWLQTVRLLSLKLNKPDVLDLQAALPGTKIYW